MSDPTESHIVQTVLGVILTGITGIISFFLKQAMDDIKSTGRDMNAFKESVPKEYATKHELTSSRTQLDERLDRIDDKLDRVLELAWRSANTHDKGQA